MPVAVLAGVAVVGEVEALVEIGEEAEEGSEGGGGDEGGGEEIVRSACGSGAGSIVGRHCVFVVIDCLSFDGGC